MIVYPNAKINIGLNVVAKRPDGYHDLETVFYPIDLQDALEVHGVNENEPMTGEGYQLKVGGTVLGGRPADNLVVRAYQLLRQEFPDKVQPVSIYLFKHVPTGAGLGGGSSDAAFMLKLLNERFDLGLTTEQLEERATRIGADCAFFVQNRPVYAEGIGNVFSDISLSLAGKTLVLVKPDVFVSTADAYRFVTPQRREHSLKELLQEPIEKWKDLVVNDFEASVFPKYPEIAAIKDRLYDLGAVYAAMSGSGASVYGIFNQPVEHVDEVFAGYFCRQRDLK
ncbi:MAG: 4-(cytidine 5'-diphospho)-2-C-methyl-D-erythritol kinase [Bacteroidaceae bacterium]|nr:4-(cytidine 5'-diphospho)-2-C-methyl-D-erythritol kinase [Bacteroidaceae bacterium]